MFTMARRTRMPRAERQLICKGDEATVSRLRRCNDPALEGWVERRQAIAKVELPPPKAFVDRGQPFRQISTAANVIPTYPFLPDEEAYHAIMYYAGRVAHLLFPDHFVNYRDWKVCEVDGTTYSHIYSDFVPDENRVQARRDAARYAFYEAASVEAANEIRLRANAHELNLNPNITYAVEAFHRFGIEIAHPEANYQVHDNKTVFFEVFGLDLFKLSQIKWEIIKKNLPDFVHLYAAILCGRANRLEAHPDLDPRTKEAILLMQNLGWEGFISYITQLMSMRIDSAYLHPLDSYEFFRNLSQNLCHLKFFNQARINIPCPKSIRKPSQKR